jgi:hypothetical protein
VQKIDEVSDLLLVLSQEKEQSAEKASIDDYELAERVLTTVEYYSLLYAINVCC